MYELGTDRFASIDPVIDESFDSFAFELFQKVTKKAFAHVSSTEAREDIMRPRERRRRRRRSHELERKLKKLKNRNTIMISSKEKNNNNEAKQHKRIQRRVNR